MKTKHLQFHNTENQLSSKFTLSISNNMVLPRPFRCLNRNNCPVCWTISGHRLPNCGSRAAVVLHFINQPGVLYTAIGKHYVATMWQFLGHAQNDQ